MTASPAPNRSPLVCGGLGAYDRRLVTRIAAGFGETLHTVHEDEESMLALDRDPLRWEGNGEQGLAWIEGIPWRDGASSWQEASRRGACGLVFSGPRRFLHTAVNGLGRVYWIADGRAAYFASRVDPLVRAWPDRLSVDWDAWAAIVALRFAPGERTPFAAVRRLEPFSTLRRRFRRWRGHSPTWPWAEAEPQLNLPEAADAIVVGLRDAVSLLDRPIAAPLSGGRDSRMVLCSLAEAGKASVALTVSDDEGDTFEEDLAAAAAAALGLPHERLSAGPADYPDNWTERAERVEYQFVDHAWLVPLAHRIEGTGTPLGDGLALDSLLQRRSRFFRSETLDHSRPRRSNLALFDSMRQYGSAHLALKPELHASIVDRARELFLSAVKPFEGNPSQANLGLYRTRTSCGVTNYPNGLLGERAEIFAPGASDAVAVAALSAKPDAKDDDRLYPAVFDRIDPAAGRLPSTRDTPRRPHHLQRCWRSAPATDMHRRLLSEGPLAPYVSDELIGWLDAPAGRELSPDLRLGMEAVSLFHSWCERYRGELRDVDPADLLG